MKLLRHSAFSHLCSLDINSGEVYLEIQSVKSSLKIRMYILHCTNLKLPKCLSVLYLKIRFKSGRGSRGGNGAGGYSQSNE